MPLQSEEFVAKAMGCAAEPLEQLKRSMAGEFLRTTGFLQLKVLGQSMLPTIWPGDLLTILNEPWTEFGIGDVGVFQRDERFFVHRIKGTLVIDGAMHFITAGDSSGHDDPPFPTTALVGKVVKIERRDLSLIPRRRCSLFNRCLGWMFAHCDLARNLALRFHAMRRQQARLSLREESA